MLAHLITTDTKKSMLVCHKNHIFLKKDTLCSFMSLKKKKYTENKDHRKNYSQNKLPKFGLQTWDFNFVAQGYFPYYTILFNNTLIITIYFRDSFKFS